MIGRGKSVYLAAAGDKVVAIIQQRNTITFQNLVYRRMLLRDRLVEFSSPRILAVTHSHYYAK